MDKNERRPNVKPSDFLNVEITDKQCEFLSPTAKDVLFGSMLHDTKGKGAVRKAAKRKLDFVDGSINSYSKLLNDTKRMEEMKQHLQLVATVAEVSEEQELQKERRKNKRILDEAEKNRKKQQKIDDNEKNKEEALPIINELIGAFITKARELDQTALESEISKKCKNQMPSNILKYFFNMDAKEISGKKKLVLVEMIAQKVIERATTT